MKVLRTLLLSLAALSALWGHAVEKEVNGIPYVPLNNGAWMPRFGGGAFNVPGDSVAADAVAYALRCGYRYIYTAHAYRVERGVGQGVKEAERLAMRYG